MGNLEHRELIRELQARYADICSRRAFEELNTVISADAVILLDLRSRTLSFTGPEEIGEFINESIKPFDFFQFEIRNSVIDVGAEGCDATGRLWMSELRHVRETGQWSTIFGVYHDQYQLTEEGWRISSRQYHSLARLSHALDDGAFFDFPENLNELDKS